MLVPAPDLTLRLLPEVRPSTITETPSLSPSARGLLMVTGLHIGPVFAGRTIVAWVCRTEIGIV